MSSLLAAVALFIALGVGIAQSQECGSPLICRPTSSPPTLDGDLREWSDVRGIETKLFGGVGGDEYPAGAAVYKCVYTSTEIYFAMEIPGRYRFTSSDNKRCASIATMFKIGEDATFYGMGGCPKATNNCADEVPSECDSYRVDIGAHWELRTTEQGKMYAMNNDNGNDPIGNKDDEYGVSPTCRFDDDDYYAANEWSGAWSHSETTSTEEMSGRQMSSEHYRFELSRTLRTKSSTTDRQLEAGETYKFGIAYWDPNQSETGWSEHGHYVTGCGSDWIDLVLVEEQVDGEDEDGQDFEDIEDSQESEEIIDDQEESEGVETLATGTTDECDAPLICYPTTTELEPTLDGDLREWADVPGVEARLHSAFGGQVYGGGSAVYKCLYTETHIVFAVEVPGRYRFSSSNNNHCASVATMFKIGEDASFYGMGGCPEARNGCENGVPPICESYRVDIGAHWELKGTEQGELYRIDTSTGTGNDIIANKDDEYGVSPHCRFDDDDEFAGNEWAGAWAHSSDQEGTSGYYRFELARLLQTKSATTDRQLAPGGSYSFGIAYWDPNEDETDGWSGPGHFVTGCGSQWIDLVLVTRSQSSGSTLTESKLFALGTMALGAFILIL